MSHEDFQRKMWNDSVKSELNDIAMTETQKWQVQMINKLLALKKARDQLEHKDLMLMSQAERDAMNTKIDNLKEQLHVSLGGRLDDDLLAFRWI